MNHISPQTNKLAFYLLTSLPFIFVIVVWLYFAVLQPIPYWQQSGDYSWYALSHAYTLEAKFAGLPASNLGYKVHPGVPFGYASWMALRLATKGVSDSADRIAYAIANTDVFWMWAKMIALTLNLAGLFLMRRIFRDDVLRFYMAFGLYFAAIPAAFDSSFLQLTNESFALVFIPLFYYLAFRLLTHEEHLIAGSDMSTQLIPNFLLLSFSLGTLTALGCSIKIYYTAPAVGIVTGFMIGVGVGVFDKAKALRFFIFFLVGFLLSGVFLVYVVIGWPAFVDWIDWNYQMLSHSDRYGHGDKGFIKMGSLMSAITDLTRSTAGTFPLITISTITIYLVATIRGIRDNSWFRKHFPFFATVLVGILVNFVGLLKHYSPLSQHYALPLCASLPCLLLIKGKGDHHRSPLKFGIVIISLLLLINLHSYASIHTKSTQTASAVIRDLEIVERLPISTEERRVWGYFSPTKQGILPMINQYAGSPFVAEVIRKNSNPNDIAPNNEPDTKKWRYVLFPKRYFQTRESIPENLPKQFDFASTNFRILETDKISELETFFLLTRTSYDMQEHPK